MWQGSEQLWMPASPETVWSIITDVERHPQLAGSGEVRAVRPDGPLKVGATWEADEHIKGPAGSFTARSEVITFEPPRVFAWRSYPPELRKGNPDSVADVTWTFILTPERDGTNVEHSYRVVEPKVGAAMLKTFYFISRRPNTIRKGMRKTLANIRASATTG
ncbi:MAG TPA: SRPBCC family protein [Mycobacteriales bacterium]|nr:SRPBCC family protein [Mycobacteriales bacterium]